jgi:nucleotide-binding universal stress UspA family protein
MAFTHLLIPTDCSEPANRALHYAFEEATCHHATVTQLRDPRPASFQGPWDVEVAAGPPAETMVHVTHERGAALMVMGTHGRTGLSHVLLGSVAEKVVRLALCPVLTVT